MIEFPDAEIRRRELARLAGIEDRVYLHVEGFEKVAAIADEDLDRSTAEKTSAVHFMRFELDSERCAALKSGAAIEFSIEHANYGHAVAAVPGPVRDSLAADLD